MEDLIYSVPHKEMFVAVGECSENYGQVLFQNRAGISVEDLMPLLELYLSATVFFFLFLTANFMCRNVVSASVLVWHRRCAISFCRL